MSSEELQRNGIQVISRAAAILRSLENAPGGLSLGEIAKRSGLPRSTVQRLVDALALEQLLQVQGASGVRLGPALMRLASRSHVDLSLRARPFLEVLSRHTGETALLTHANGLSVMILQSVVSHQELRVAPGPGTFLHIHASSGGKVLLAGMPDPAVRALLEGNMKRLTPMTLALDGLLEQLQAIRRCGFATDGGEHMVGVGSVSTGLQTDQGHYALTVVGPVARIQAADGSLRQALLECREGIQHSVDSA